MTDSTRQYWARVCLYSSWVFVILSGMLLCACPLLPGLGLSLAISAIVLRQGHEVLAPLVAVLVTGMLTITHTVEKVRERGIRAKAEAIRNRSATNSTPAAPASLTSGNR